MRFLWILLFLFVFRDGAHSQERNVWQRLLGKCVSTSQYTNPTDDPVSSSDQLACNFDSSTCCWSNADSTIDHLDWVLVKGKFSLRKFESNFGTNVLPSGTALSAATETFAADQSEQKAIFYSCAIPCTDGAINVELQHWQTQDVTIRVCQIIDPTATPTQCETLSSGSGITETVNLPGGQNQRIGIFASGFTTQSGSIAVIDKISTHYTSSTTCGGCDNNYETLPDQGFAYCATEQDIPSESASDCCRICNNGNFVICYFSPPENSDPTTAYCAACDYSVPTLSSVGVTSFRKKE